MPQGNVRLPDVFFWSKAQNEQRKTHYLDGPVDLVIEIVSPSTRTIDYTDKYDEYQTAGCREYWILDPKTGRHSFFVLDAETKSYRPLATVTDDADREFIRSTTVPDLWFDLSWFADRPAEQDVVATWQAAKGSAA
jgi:Uma2 family endonuclease